MVALGTGALNLSGTWWEVIANAFWKATGKTVPGGFEMATPPTSAPSNPTPQDEDIPF